MGLVRIALIGLCPGGITHSVGRKGGEDMAALVGGIVATILGVVLLVVWWGYFVQLLAGAVPLVLVLGGALAIYIGIDEIKDKLQQSKES